MDFLNNTKFREFANIYDTLFSLFILAYVWYMIHILKNKTHFPLFLDAFVTLFSLSFLLNWLTLKVYGLKNNFLPCKLTLTICTWACHCGWMWKTDLWAFLLFYFWAGSSDELLLSVCSYRLAVYIDLNHACLNWTVCLILNPESLNFI